MKNFAKELRQNLTSAEAILWTYLKNKKIGYKFRRQYVIQNYILDFCNKNFYIFILTIRI